MPTPAPLEQGVLEQLQRGQSISRIYTFNVELPNVAFLMTYPGRHWAGIDTWESTDLIWEIPLVSSRYTLELSISPPEAAAWGAKVWGGSENFKSGRVAHPGATVQTECIEGQRYLFSKWNDAWTGVHWDVQNPTSIEINTNRAIEAVYRKSSSSCSK